ncbi:MAG TPA: response regulator transcription factor [Candidatus Thioglobus sp.]|jgi:DNA-binding response OmpR family regulator|nr:response regulator transcription factor [Candidatus Thioglobus sp.]HIL42977.1 response regulator transcription factor [Gammaproteobacteria bacterium]
MEKLAIIDDDAEILKLLNEYLTKSGFEVYPFVDGESFLAEDSNQFNLLVLDIGLPGIDGLEVCRVLRQDSSIPIIMLTAASDDLDRILGLELGADDYVSKPFNPRELLARIKALLRRTRLDEEKSFPININHNAREVTVDGNKIELTGAEFDLLCVLASHTGSIQSRDSIGESLRGRRTLPDDRSIDTIVSRLRHKLSDHFEGEIIKSVRGKGYVLLSK